MKKIAFLISLTFLLIGVYILPHYAMNWDEAVHFYRGESYLQFFLTGKKDYKDLKPVPRYYQKDDNLFFDPVGQGKSQVNRRSMFMNDQINFKWFIQNDSGHPPVSDIFSSFFNFILFQKLGFINDVDSYHIYSIFLSAILVGVLFWWVSRSYGIFAGFVSALSLSLFPLFLGESHFNIKDPPEAVFYTLTAILFFEGFVRKKYKLLIASSIIAGFALGTKFNVVFLPFSLLPWLILYLFPQRKKIKEYFRLIPSIILYPIISLLIVYALWPFLWNDPIKNFLSTIEYYRSIGTNPNFDPRFITFFGVNTYAVQWILYTTPVVILLFSAIGTFYALTKGAMEKDKKLYLILLLFFISILRVTRPDAGIYGGLRQIMEFVPAMSILCGLGALFARKKILFLFRNIQINNKQLIVSILFTLLFLPLFLKLISIHPNEDMYFNPIIGGLNGAVAKNFPDWGNSLGNQYRVGIRWINENANKNSKLTLDSGLGSNIPENLLREDLRFSTLYRSSIQRKGEYVIGLVNTGYEDTYVVKYLNRFLVPLYEEKVDGVPVLKIWKNDLTHTKPQYRDYKLLLENPKNYITGNTLFIDFGKNYSLTEIYMEFSGICTKDTEGSIQISTDNESWDTLDNILNNQFLLPFSTYQKDNQFIYYLAADKGRYLEFNFTSNNSCFKSVGDIKVYGFPD